MVMFKTYAPIPSVQVSLLTSWDKVIGSVNTILTQIYGDRFTNSPQRKNVNAIAFAGTVFGQLLFGVLSDYWSRKWSLLISTVVLIIFSALSAGAYGAGGSLGGMLAALTAYRFLVGIGIGGEYPAGSVGAAESTGELKKGHRNRWFILFTDFQIDLGFVAGVLVPMILVLIFGENHLRAAWRVALGLGVVPPLSLFYLRLKLKEPEEYNRQRMKKYPYWLILKFYGFRLAVVSIIWFIYDFVRLSGTLYGAVLMILVNLFLQYLLIGLDSDHHRRFCSALGCLWLDDFDQYILCSRLVLRSVSF